MHVKGVYPSSINAGIPRLGKNPDHWEPTKFGKILEIIERKAVLNDENLYSLVVVKRNRGGICFRKQLMGKEIKTKTQFYIKKGDFLISKRQIIHGACAIVPPELEGSIVSNEYSILRAKNGLNIEFIKYYSHTPYFQQACFHSSVGVHVEKMIFRINNWFKYKLYLPPLLEQKKIVEILSTWDLAIERTERLVERKKEFFNQIIDSLFNKNCSSWQKSTLSQIAKITMGQSPSSKYYNSEQKGLPLIQGNADIINRKTSPKLWTESITKSCEFGDIVMTVRAPAGVIAQSSHNACLGRGVCAIKATKIEHNFLYYTLLNYEKQWTKLEQGSTFKSINSKEIKQLVIKYPKGKENQNKIASLLSALDNEIRFLEQELIKLKQQKKGLLQKLLSGEVRVKP